MTQEAIADMFTFSVNCKKGVSFANVGVVGVSSVNESAYSLQVTKLRSENVGEPLKVGDIIIAANGISLTR